MSLVSFSHSEYQAGGSLPPDAPTYITRQADHLLYQAVLAGEYCYVLNARQMGKSSLRISTMVRLLKEGVACTEIELSGIGSQEITAAQWYGGLIQEMVSGLGLRLNVGAWLQDQKHLSPVQCLGTFIETILLKQVEGLIVIFIDEIDSVLSLNFNTDEFFSLIRNFYDKRASEPNYKRLSCVFLGVAAPADLIQDKGKSAPFNIGTAIPLCGFQIQDCIPLMQGLSSLTSDPTSLMQAVLDWTGGQPFLTQKVCALLVQTAMVNGAHESSLELPQSSDEGSETVHSHDNGNGSNLSSLNQEGNKLTDPQQAVAQLIQTHILTNWESQDEPEHLRTIRDRLLRNASNSNKLLKLYKDILRLGSIRHHSGGKQHLELRLSGLVEVHQGRLRVKNKIYQQVFSPAWIAEQQAALTGHHNRATTELDSGEATTLEGAVQPAQPQPAPLRGIARSRLNLVLTSLLITLVTTSITMGLRSLGLLQAWELTAYDQLMALRPSEGVDPRLFLITVTETDVQAQPAGERGGVSISDPTLKQLLAKLQTSPSRVIGFDLYREEHTQDQTLVQQLSQGDIYFICHFGQPGVPSSPDLPIGFAGFNNTAIDQDGVVRRQVLAVDDATPCHSNVSFAIKLAERYLYEEQLPLQTSNGMMGFGETLFEPLVPSSYPRNETEGYQLLLNYRATDAIAESATLSQVLDSSFDLERFRDRIVLIGTVASSFNDHRWPVPHLAQPVAGLEIQGHMTSQLISTVLDRRPMIKLWPGWGEWIWVAGWSASMALLVGPKRSLLTGLAITGGFSIVLVGSSLVLLLNGAWVPLIPVWVSGGIALGIIRRVTQLPQP